MKNGKEAKQADASARKEMLFSICLLHYSLEAH
jgi:hypothetical protein